MLFVFLIVAFLANVVCVIINYDSPVALFNAFVAGVLFAQGIYILRDEAYL